MSELKSPKRPPKSVKPCKKPKKQVFSSGRSFLKPPKPISTDDRRDQYEPHLLYRVLERQHYSRMTQLREQSIDCQLEDIEFEIKLRVKITQQEIFFIGELLVYAREILKEKGHISFKEWVTKNFDFGYHTAINFCNVFTVCIGELENMIAVKPSVLYEISSKHFPKKLRDFLIFNNLIDTIRVKDLKELFQEYKENGFEAVRSKLEEKSIIPLLVNQELIPYLDSLTQITHYLDKQIHELERSARRRDSSIFVVGAEKNGNDNYFMISESFKKCFEVLKEAKETVNKKTAALYKIRSNDMIAVNDLPSCDCDNEIQVNRSIQEKMTSSSSD